MALLKTALAIAGLTSIAQAVDSFPYLTNQTIWQPERGVEQAIYPRYVELLDGTILVTSSQRWYEHQSKNAKNHFPVFSSSDGGMTWDWISNITDEVNGWGLGAQPALCELMQPYGDYDAGTILASGNSWSDTATKIDLYASMDKGQTWEFVSNIAQGGPPNTTNGAQPGSIWEPYLMEYDNQVVAYYSDSRDPQHGQKLAHQATTDLKNWGPVVNDVAMPTYADRPGMTVIARIPGDNWVFVHEYPGGYSMGLANYPVFYHIAKSPLEFYNDDPSGKPIIANGFQPSASPYVVWSPVGGVNGTIVVSDADHYGVFTNTMLGAEDQWRYHHTEHMPSYSRALAVWRNQPEKLAIIDAGAYDDAATNISRPLRISVMDLEAMVRENAPPQGPTPIQVYYPDLVRSA